MTGAHGFVGEEVCRQLLEKGAIVTAATRTLAPVALDEERGFRQVPLGNFGTETDWSSVLQGVEVIIHLAARVHVMQDSSADPLAEFRQVNVAATAALARAAAASGVRRFIFLSSIKVNGEKSDEHPLTERDAPNPQDPYGISKWEAEQVLKDIAAETGMQLVILRPPLVYGPNVRANFLRLLRWVDQGVPLPLAAIHNRRSMIYLGNLVDAITTCVDHPDVAGNTYLLSDGEDISSSDLIRQLAGAFGKPARLWALPQALLRLLGGLAGKGAEVDRLLGSLQIDASKFRVETNWVPPFTLQQGLTQTVDWYRRVYAR